MLQLTDVLCEGCTHRVKYTNWCGMLMIICSKNGERAVLNAPMLDCDSFDQEV